tara:strand:- start:920 stop:2986 length:2067 start_codon:yes stop_codon:yes gene_type:complete
MLRILVIFFCLYFSFNFSLAQEQEFPVIEEVIVNADYRLSDLNDIPSSVIVLDENLIQNRNAQHLEEILLNAPNVNFSSGSSRARFFQIRGIGERGQFSEPLNSSVGVIIDGIDFSGIGNASMLYDIDQVEVFLGPQGTRYGSNALAGLINLQSKAPTKDLSYGLKLESGDYNSNGLGGYLSGPLSEQFSYRISAQQIKSDGFNMNRFLNDETNTRNERVVRGKIKGKLLDDVELDVTASTIKLNNGYDAFSLDNNRDTLSDQPGSDIQESELLSARVTVSRFKNFTFDTLLGYGDSQTEYSYDEDWVYDGFHPWGYSSTDQYNRDRSTESTEFRFTSSEDGKIIFDTTDWVFGFYYLGQEVNLERIYTFSSQDFISSYDTRRLAIYGETDTQLNNDWNLTVGIRGERFSADYHDSSLVNFKPSENLVGGRVTLTYNTAANTLVYSTISQGYKAGGFNTDGTLDPDLRDFDSEGLLNYEIGFKGLLFENRFQTQIALFFMNRDDVQISSSIVRTRENGSSEFIDYIGNAATGSNYGLEFSGNFKATERFDFYGSLGLLKTRYDDFINSAGDNLEGREQAHAPSYQYSLGANIQLGNNVDFGLNILGKDSFYFSDSHGVQSNAYHLINANLSYTWEDWKVMLWGRNLTDEDYFVRGFYFGNDPRDNYLSKGYTQLGEPARIGVTINLDF